MRKSNKKKQKTIPLIAAAVFLLLCLAGAFVLLRQESPAAPASTSGTAAAGTQTSEQPRMKDVYELENGLRITRIGKYAGAYLEDGSDEPVTDLLMILVENASDEDLQLARICLEYPDAEAVFQLTNLPAGESALVVEQNRMAYTPAAPVSVRAENVVTMETFPMHEDLFRITALDGCINVKNISDTDIDGDISVYYKNYSGGQFYGGITYRARVEGGLKAGEIRQVMTGHYDAEGSRILMVTYAD